MHPHTASCVPPAASPLHLVGSCSLATHKLCPDSLLGKTATYSQNARRTRHDSTQTWNSLLFTPTIPKIVRSHKKPREEEKKSEAALRAHFQRPECRTIRPDRLGAAHRGDHR